MPRMYSKKGILKGIISKAKQMAVFIYQRIIKNIKVDIRAIKSDCSPYVNSKKNAKLMDALIKMIIGTEYSTNAICIKHSLLMSKRNSIIGE